MIEACKPSCPRPAQEMEPPVSSDECRSARDPREAVGGTHTSLHEAFVSLYSFWLSLGFRDFSSMKSAVVCLASVPLRSYPHCFSKGMLVTRCDSLTRSVGRRICVQVGLDASAGLLAVLTNVRILFP